MFPEGDTNHEKQLRNLRDFYLITTILLNAALLVELLGLQPQYIGMAAGLLELIHINLGELYSWFSRQGFSEAGTSAVIFIITGLVSGASYWRYIVYRNLLNNSD